MQLLMPPPLPIYPAGFNFMQYAFFKEIGAFGFVTRKIQVISKQYKIASIEALRSYIKQHYSKNIVMLASAITSDMIMGDASAIDEKTFEVFEFQV